MGVADPTSVTAGDFHALMGTIEAPMVIATTATATDRAGCLVGFWTQCSIDPPRAVIFLSDKNHTFHLSQRASHLAVHLLTESQRDLAELFGGETGDDVDKFARTEWRNVAGVPVLDACDRWFVGRVVERLAAGDHVGLLLEPIQVSAPAAAAGDLTLDETREIDPGHDP
jgi:flavin reductase (DIM6/NTAB) family NADH-FMN oxidoreductase RutF